MESYKRNIEIYYDPKKERTTIVGWNLSAEQRNQLALILLGNPGAVKPAPSMDTPSPVETMTPPSREEMGSPLTSTEDNSARMEEIQAISAENPVVAVKQLLEVMSGSDTEVTSAAITKNKEIAQAVFNGLQNGTVAKSAAQNYLYAIRSLNPAMEAGYRNFVIQMGIDNTLPYDKAVIEVLKAASDNQILAILKNLAA